MSSNEHPDMSGSGCDDPEPEACTHCGGCGELCNCGQPLNGSHDHLTCGPHIKCETCNGTGAIPYEIGDYDEY